MRILFITATRIGDAVLSTGLLAHLIERYPDVRITVAAGRVAAPIFGAVPGLERLILMDKQRYGGHWLRLWRRTVLTRWDIVVDLRASAIAYTLLAKRRYVAQRRDDRLHRVEEQARLMGIDPPPAPKVWTLQPHQDLASSLIPDGGAVLAIGPAANWAGNRRLTDKDGILPRGRIAVFAAKHERRQITPCLRALPKERTIDLVGRVELPVAAACLERCAFFVGNDSGLMHLAAAVGVPTLGLFGPSPERRYRPWGEKAAFVRTPESFEELISAPDYDHRTTGSLMGSLSVDAAEEGARGLWAKVGGQGGQHL
jgi:ADP-heptose:LPS heptosyltransferase